MEKRLLILTKNEVRHLAFELPVKCGLPHPFRLGESGEDWLRAFLKSQSTDIPSEARGRFNQWSPRLQQEQR